MIAGRLGSSADADSDWTCGQQGSEITEFSIYESQHLT